MQPIFVVLFSFQRSFRTFDDFYQDATPNSQVNSQSLPLQNVRRLYGNLNYSNTNFMSNQTKYFSSVIYLRLYSLIKYQLSVNSRSRQELVVRGYPYLVLRLRTFLPKLTLIYIDLALTFFGSHYFYLPNTNQLVFQLYSYSLLCQLLNCINILFLLSAFATVTPRFSSYVVANKL